MKFYDTVVYMKLTPDSQPTSEPTSGSPIERLRSLLDAYPGITVVRERTGPIDVAQELPMGDMDRSSFVFIGKDLGDSDTTVKVSARYIPKDRKGDWDGSPYTYLKVTPVNQQDVAIEVTHPQPDIDVEEVVTEVRQGLEIFEALLAVPELERGLYNPKAYDWMHPAGVEQDAKESGLGAIAEGLGDDYGSPNNWQVIKNILDKNIVRVTKV